MKVSRYPVLVDGKEGAFGVVVPDLPGCTAMGATIEEALDNARAAMRDWMDATIEAGGAVPAPAAEMIAPGNRRSDSEKGGILC